MENKHLAKTILTAIGEQPHLQLVILFGSVATGHASAGSDLDLAVDAGHPLTAEEKMALIASLAQSTGRPVDLIDLRTTGEPLLGQILSQGRRILGSDERYANLIRRHLLDEADFLPYRNRILEHRRRTWIGS